MKSHIIYLLLTSILIFLTLSMFSSPVAAEGTWDSNVEMSIPTLSLNQESTITTTVSSSVMTPFTGNIDYYGIGYTHEYGPKTTTTVQYSDSPNFVFTPTFNLNTSVFRIPLDVDGAAAGEFYFDLYQGSTLLVTGGTNSEGMQMMMENGYYMVVLGTEMAPDTNEISLNAGQTYSLRLYNSDNVTYTIDVGTSGTSQLLDEGTSTGYSPIIHVMTSEYLGEGAVSSGASSVDITPAKYWEQILGYYSTSSSYFAASYQFKSPDFTRSSSYTATAGDKTVESGSTTTLSAVFENNGDPISGLTSDFRLVLNDYQMYLGSAQTDSAGRAQLNYTPNRSPGTYTYSVTSTAADYVLTDNATLTITPPTGYLSSVSATGSYATSEGNQSVIEISGRLLTSSSDNPIQNATVEVSKSSTTIVTTNTDSSGYFSISTIETVNPGTITDFYTISSDTIDYTISDLLVDLVVTKGDPNILLNSTEFNLNYDDMATIAGNLTDESGDLINTEIYLERYNSDTNRYDRISTQSINGLFSFELPTDSTGIFDYRINSLSNAYYRSAVSHFSVSVGKVMAEIVTDQDLYIIPYHESAMINIDIQSDYSAEADLRIEVMDGSDILQYNLLYEISTTNKSFSFEWAPTDEYLEYQNYDYTLRITLISNQGDPYESIVHTTKFEYTWTNLTANLLSEEAVIGVEKQLEFDVIDTSGNDVQNMITFELEIDGIILESTSINGMVSFSYTFDTAQQYIVILRSTIQFPYSSFNQNITIQVDKGSFHMLTSNVEGFQGGYATLNGQLFNHNNISASANISIQQETATWETLATVESDMNGYFSHELYLDAEFGLTSHTIRFYISGNSSYYQLETYITVDVTKALTKLSIIHNSQIEYNSDPVDREVEVQLTTELNDPIANAQLELTYNQNTTTITTDSTGRAQLRLENQMLPGTYNIIVTYAGSDIYVNSDDTSNISVIGTLTFMEFTKSSVDTFRGEYLELEFRLYDSQNFNLSSAAAKFFFNDVLVATTQTNSSGFASVSIQVVFSSDIVDVRIEVDAFSGYEGVSSEQSFTQIRRDLGANVSVNNDNSPIIYQQDTTNITIQAYSNYDTRVSGATTRVLLWDYSSQEYVFISSGLTNSTGYFTTQIQLPVIDSSLDYIFKFEILKQYYEKGEIILPLAINKASFNVEVTAQDTTYLNATPISFQIFGDELAGMEISIVIIENNYEFETTFLTDLNGFAFLDYPADVTGTITISYTVTDPSRNYGSFTGYRDIEIRPTEVILDANQIDIQSDPYLNLTITLYGQYISATMELDYDGLTSEMVIINGTYLIDMSGWTDVTITILSSDKYLSQSISKSIERESIGLEVHTQILYAQVENSFSIELLTDQNLNGHTVNIFVNNQGQLEILGSFTTYQSWVNVSLETLLEEGMINLFIEYPTQSFFEYAELSLSLDVVKQEVEVSFHFDELISGTNVEFDINTSSQINLLPEQLTLQVFIQGEIILNTSIVSGSDTVNLAINNQLGEYQLEIIILETTTTHRYESVSLVTIQQQTELIRLTSDLYQYNDVNVIIFQLRDPSTGNGIANQSITAYKCNTFCTTSSAQVGILITNSTGHIAFTIPDELTPNIYSFYLYFDVPNKQAAQNKIDVQIYPEQPEIDITVEDFGISHNITITIEINDESGLILQPGELTIIIDDQNYTVSNIQGRHVIILTGEDAMGTQSISVTYLPESEYYFSAQTASTFGWEQISGFEIVGTTTIGYLSRVNLEFMATSIYQDITLTNIDVAIYINGEFYLTSQILNGQLVEKLDLQPGIYDFRVEINNSIYFTHIVSEEVPIIMEKGEVPFSVGINDARYGDTVRFDMEDDVSNSTYQIRIIGENNLDYTNLYETTENIFLLPNILPVGGYSVQITRYHSYLEDYTYNTTITVAPINAAITAEQQDNQYLALIITPTVQYLDFTVLLELYNDTHAFNWSLTNLQSSEFIININTLHSGNYILQYEISGVYHGSDSFTISLEFPPVQPSQPTTSDLPGVDNGGLSDGEMRIAGLVIVMVMVAVPRVRSYLGN